MPTKKLGQTEISPDKMQTFGWHYVRLAFCPVGILSYHHFFVPFPFPNCGNGSISFPSRILGMELSIPVPVPKLQKFCSYNRASTYLMIIAQAVGPARSSCAEVKLEERNRLIDVFTEGPLVYFQGKKNPSQSLFALFCPSAGVTWLVIASL